jgi:voltage-gated potassium channel
MKASDLYLVLRRLRRRLTQLWRGIAERPMVRAGGVIILLSLFFSGILYLIEKNPPDKWDVAEKGVWPYSEFFLTVKQVIILLFSGFDINEQPVTPSGFLLAMILVCLGIAFIVLVTADMASVLVTLAASGQGRRKVRISDHVLICGWHDSIRSLIEQLTSHDRDSRREIVIIDADTDRLPFRDPDVHFVKGDPTQEETLMLASADRAHSVIVSCDSRLPEHLQDSAATLTMMAAKDANSEMYTCIEILRGENRRHLERLNIDEVVCLGEFAQALLAQASVSHGLSKLIEELLTFNEGNEIYRVDLPPVLAGETFRSLLGRINSERQALLVAVERDGKLYTNPSGRFVLEPEDALFVVAESRPEQLEELVD